MEHYEFHCKVEYPDLGVDAQLSHLGALRMMQEAACQDSSRTGYGPFDVERNGVAWIICGWKVRLDRRPHWGEDLTVATWPRTMSNHLSERDFQIFDSQGALVGAATSRWLLIDVRTGHVTNVTPEIAAAYALDCDSRALEGEMASNGKSPEGAAVTFTYTALRRDLDMFHHINNLHYLELAREALPEAVLAAEPATVEILYKRQIKLGDKVQFFYSYDPEEKKHLVELKDAAGKKSHALVWFY